MAATELVADTMVKSHCQPARPATPSRLAKTPAATSPETAVASTDPE